jgi:amino acid adenylation domain-containing protein
MNRKRLPPLDLQHAFFADATLSQLFVDAAMSFPEKTALRSDEGDLNYLALLQHAQAVAAELRAAGVRPGSLVGLAMSRSSAAIGAILGTLMAGGAYVPLDAEGSPVGLLKQQIADSNIAHVLVDGEMDCKATAWDRCSKTRVPSPFAQASAHVPSPAVEVTANHPAYVMFTSGSTGKPKGVMVPHRAVVRLVSGQHYLNFSPNETFLLHSPLSFDASTLEIWGSLLHGGCLAIAPARPLAATDYLQILERYEVTTLWMTAAIFHLVADYAPETFRPLRQLIVGGDVIQPRAARKIQQQHPHLNVVNGYGPTENCTFTACYRIPHSVDTSVGLPIGRPIEHTTAYVLNPDLQPVADGQTGELVTGGSGVALGYLNLPQETAERFLPDPFSPIAGAFMYRTGDRVRKDASGIFHFLGRFDQEVKISGRRIDLTELEALVMQQDGVRACAAIATDSGEDQKELALAVEMPAALPTADQAIRRQLASQLPAAVLPTHILVAERLPVNANGKLDRAAIKQELQNRFIAEHKRPGSTNEDSTHDSTQATVLQLWRELLGNQSVALDDNFFDAGGSSLLLIRLHARLHETYPGRLSVLDLFQATTARKLSDLIDARITGSIAPAHRRPETQTCDPVITG